MSLVGHSPTRVGARVRKKSKRYEDFVSGGVGGEADLELPHRSPHAMSPRGAGTSSSSAASVRPSPPSRKAVPRDKEQRRGTLRQSGFTAWSKSASKQLLSKMPTATPLELKDKLAETWNTLPDEERDEWRALAEKEALDPQPWTATRKKPGPKPKPKRGPSPKSPKALAARKNASGTGDPKSKKPTSKKTDNQKDSRSSSGRDEPEGDSRGPALTTMDAAAHLHLLGESMQFIGQKLTEHQGPIAVSGSVSVLLDALLSATGPLLCLAQELPVMQGAIPDNLLRRIIDDTHYFMPGL